MTTNANTPRRERREQLLPALATLDQHILIVGPSQAPAIHAALLLPNASVFTSSAGKTVDFPTQVS